MDRVYLAGGKLDRDVAVKVLRITKGPALVQQPCRLQASPNSLLDRNGLRRWRLGAQRLLQRVGALSFI